MNIEKQETIAYLEQEREVWVPARARMVRSAGMNAEANAAFNSSNRRMNHLLEDLFQQTVVIEVSDGIAGL